MSPETIASGCRATTTVLTKSTEAKEKFNIDHHENTRISAAAKMGEWRKATASVDCHRCKKCWLRTYDCYCQHLDKMADEFSHDLGVSVNKNINVLMYYHYMEMGRSANTAHLFEALCPSICDPLIFCDQEKEHQLWNEMQAEHERGEYVTCVLYPTKDAILLSEWMARRPESARSKGVRLIMLDGTYPCAHRQLKHIQGVAREKHFDIPVVKLDLEQGMCKSAIAGIMSQPDKDKICTYQALVMAMQQCGMEKDFCSKLSAELDLWLLHIVKSRVKIGKGNVPNSRKLEGVDRTPQEKIAAVIVSLLF